MNCRHYRSICLTILFALTAMAPSRSAVGQDVETHKLESKHQRGPTVVRVLAPPFEAGKTYRVIYVLPVIPGVGTKWGDSVAEFAKLKVAEKHQVICAFPSFSDLPWFADHPTDKQLQQESYFLEDVVGLIEAKYPAQQDRAGRLLLGFSKSGWGALSLLLRHPERFDRAAAFDAPLMMGWPSKFGSQPIFATEENFRPYQVSALIEQQARHLKQRERLAIIGKDVFVAEHAEFQKRLEKLEIPHHFVEGPVRKHHWNSGWVADAVEFLVAP